jgi:hypothetical protein
MPSSAASAGRGSVATERLIRYSAQQETTPDIATTRTRYLRRRGETDDQPRDATAGHHDSGQYEPEAARDECRIAERERRHADPA